MRAIGIILSIVLLSGLGFYLLRDIPSSVWLLTFFLYTVIAGLLLLLYRLARHYWPRLPAGMAFSVVLFMALLFVADVSLRYGLKVGLNWHEANHGIYKSPYDDKPRRYWTYMPGRGICFEKAEFTHSREVNSLGLTQKNMEEEKADSLYRILAIGDSFTEGMGAGYDSSWPRLLEDMLNHCSTGSYQVYNAGVAGSDPVFGYMLYKEKLLGYKADMVLLCINNSDIFDIIVHKGLERYGPDSSVTYNEAPWWEPIYKSSMVLRLFMKGVLGYNHLMLSPSGQAEKNAEATEKLIRVLELWGQLCHDNNCRFAVAMHPMEYEMLTHKYAMASEKLSRYLQAQDGFPYIDMLKEMHKRADINENNIREWYWEIDRHFKPKGYRLFARSLTEELSRQMGWDCHR